MKPLILIIAITLSACSLTTQNAARYDAEMAAKICDTFPHISYSGKLDSQPTKEQIRTYNAKIKAFCANQTK